MNRGLSKRFPELDLFPTEEQGHLALHRF